MTHVHHLSSTPSPHLLDLKRSTGRLMRKRFELCRPATCLPPACRPPAARLLDGQGRAGTGRDGQARTAVYTRRQDRSWLPDSYRTGLAFFGSILLLASMGISALSAQSVAAGKKLQVSEQVQRSMSGFQRDLNELTSSPRHQLIRWEAVEHFELEEMSDRKRVSQRFSELSALPGLAAHQQLNDINLLLYQGLRDFKGFVEDWQQPARGSALAQLAEMKGSATAALAAWERVLMSSGYSLMSELNETEQETLLQSLQLIGPLVQALKGFEKLYEPLRLALGAEEPQRVLVLITDKSQQRASGGALSAGMEWLINEGGLLSQRSFHVDEMDAQLRVDLPPPLKLDAVARRWGLATANAYLDASGSAEKVSWFWQREARSSVDLVVFVDISTLESIFRIVGGGSELAGENSPENQSLSLQWALHRLDGEREALKALTQQSFDRLLGILRAPELILPHLGELGEVLRHKQLLVNSWQADLQTELESLQLTGSLPPAVPEEDFLMVGHVNIGEVASDRWIREQRTLHTSVTETGTIRHWLQLGRYHAGKDVTAAQLRDQLGFQPSAGQLRRLARGTHESFTRLLVPQGSRLISVSGLDPGEVTQTDTEMATVWSFSSEIEAAGSSSIALIYELPWTLQEDIVNHYKLRLLAQPGSHPVAFEHVFRPAAGMTVYQQLPQDPLRILDRDLRVGVVVGR